MILPSLLGPVGDDAPRVLSVCSGVGGKDLGFHRGGFRTVGLCEWDPWRRRVLVRHWPGVPIHEDLERLADWAEADPEAVREWCGGQPDVLIGGTPCQDLSSAGRRAGLDGDRSRLFWDFMRVRHALGIEWTVWENVRGALTSNGGLDFMAVVGAFVGATLTVPAAGVGGAGVAAGPRGGCVWRLLNAQWFGVPQRRRRVFVVGRLGGECPPQVLLERVGGRRHLAEGGAAGAVPPWAAAARVGGVGRPGLAGRGERGGRDGGGGVLGDGAMGRTVGALDERGGGADDNEAQAGQLVAGALTQRVGKGVDSDGAGMPLVGGAPDGVPVGGGEPGRSEGRRVVAAAGEGGATADDVAGGVAPVDADGVRAVDGVAGRVDGDVDVFTERTRNGAYLPEQSELVPALKGSTGVGGGGHQTFVKRRSAGEHDSSPESWGEADVARTVSAHDAHRQDTSPALVAHDAYNGSTDDVAQTLRSGGSWPMPSGAVPLVDGRVADVGSCAVDPLPDGRRYAGCGDGVAAPQAHFIALRLRFVMRGEDPDAAWAQGRWEPSDS
jgi:DNA (cytosine-5)-methyltransferase 1